MDRDCGNFAPCHDKIQNASGIFDYRGVFIWGPCDPSFIEKSTWTGASACSENDVFSTSFFVLYCFFRYSSGFRCRKSAPTCLALLG
nr:hypothetical protein P5664_03715 [Bacillus subtilis]